MHSIVASQIEQHGRDAQARLLHSIEAVQVIHKKHRRTPERHHSQPQQEGLTRARAELHHLIQRGWRAVIRRCEERIHPPFHLTRARHLPRQFGQRLSQLTKVLAQPVANELGRCALAEQRRRILREHAHGLLLVRARQPTTPNQANDQTRKHPGAYLAQSRPVFRLARHLTQSLQGLQTHPGPRDVHIRAEHQRHCHTLRVRRRGDSAKEVRFAIPGTRRGEQEQRLARRAGQVFHRRRDPLHHIAIQGSHGALFHHLKRRGAHICIEWIGQRASSAAKRRKWRGWRGSVHSRA